MHLAKCVNSARQTKPSIKLLPHTKNSLLHVNLYSKLDTGLLMCIDTWIVNICTSHSLLNRKYTICRYRNVEKWNELSHNSLFSWSIQWRKYRDDTIVTCIWRAAVSTFIWKCNQVVWVKVHTPVIVWGHCIPIIYTFSFSGTTEIIDFRLKFYGQLSWYLTYSVKKYKRLS